MGGSEGGITGGRIRRRDKRWENQKEGYEVGESEGGIRGGRIRRGESIEGS